MNTNYQGLIQKLGKDRVKINESLSEYTTYKIGGPADLFFEAKNEEEFVNSIKLAEEEKINYFVLGAGSNVLIGDKGFRGLVIKISYGEIRIENNLVIASAGLLVSVLINECLKNSLAGLEFMAGIPGTVGGAVRGNAGAWQESTGDFINRVKILSLNREVVWVEKNNCSFFYRESRFKKSGEIVLEAEFGLKKGIQSEISRKISENMEKRESQPKQSSAGCVFVNPKPQSAGDLIERCGLKNRRHGNAEISDKHANFIVNLGGAKASEILFLIDLVKREVKNQFDIDLKEEIIKIGEF